MTQRKYEMAQEIRALLAAEVPGLHRLSVSETAALLDALRAKFAPMERQ